MNDYEIIKIPGKQKNGDYIEIRRVCSNDMGLPDNIFIREAEEECSNLAIHKRFARRRMITHMQYEVRRYRNGRLIAKGLFKNSPRAKNEVLAYQMCKIYGIPCCKAELAIWKNNTGSISWYDLRIDENGIPIDNYIEGNGLMNNYITHKEQITGIRDTRDEKDISLILDVIDYAVMDYYSQKHISEKELMEHIKRIRSEVFAMAIFDRLHGNGDRHNNNWGLKVFGDTGDIALYPLFDNEAIDGDIDVETLSFDIDRIANILKKYSEEAAPVFKRIVDNFTKAMEVVKKSKKKSIVEECYKPSNEEPVNF